MSLLIKITSLSAMITWLCLGTTGASAAENEQSNAVTDLKIEELVKIPISPATKKDQIKSKMLNMKVSSVSKSSQSLSNSAAAVFVIDNEAIKRSGATSVPEALRMAPGIDVARINNSKWAVTARGFNGRFANKLLVLIDGRSVYTPDFSGVYWDTQDIMMEDVERIEVIRGPGATLWGANAVNGVINIITKHSEDTQGGLLSAGGGTQETGFGALRYGTKLAKDTYARVYGKGFSRDAFATQKPANGNGDWSQYQGGIRVDSNLSVQDSLMAQANAYQGQPNQNLQTFASPTPVNDQINTSGWNFTSRYNHNISSTADYSLQFYYDHYQRDEYAINNRRDTLDLDFQNNFAYGDYQNFIWGLGYRYSTDLLRNQPTALFTPNARNNQLFSAFVQDEIRLLDDALLLTLGSKFEHNDFTGFQIQPSISAIWTPVAGHKIWGSISRAVRTPSRAEHNSKILVQQYPALTGDNSYNIPINLYLQGNSAYRAEHELSYQLGYRFMFSNNTSWDITAFYNDYDSLRIGALTIPEFTNGAIEVSEVFNNRSRGHTLGFETSGVWLIAFWWRWDLSYSYLHTRLINDFRFQNAISPSHTASLRAAINPMDKVSVDFWLRSSTQALAINPYSSHEQKVGGYISLDARIAWQLLKQVEISITGQNLLQNQHLEYYDESYALPSGVPRSVYGKISWHF